MGIHPGGGSSYTELSVFHCTVQAQQTNENTLLLLAKLYAKGCGEAGASGS